MVAIIPFSYNPETEIHLGRREDLHPNLLSLLTLRTGKSQIRDQAARDNNSGRVQLQNAVILHSKLALIRSYII